MGGPLHWTARRCPAAWKIPRFKAYRFLLFALLLALVNFVWLDRYSRSSHGPQAAPSPAPDFHVVWFYTEEHANKSARLEASCQQFGIPYSFTLLYYNQSEPKSKASLLSLKPWFIDSKMRLLRTPIIYVDSDLVFLKYPTLFSRNSTVEADFMGINWLKPDGKRSKNDIMTSSGVSFWNNTLPAQALLKAWRVSLHSYHNIEVPDDQVFDAQFNSDVWMPRLRFHALDVETYLAFGVWDLRSDKTVIDHPDANARIVDRKVAPRPAPTWLAEHGQIFNNDLLIGAVCLPTGSSDVTDSNPAVLDVSGLNGGQHSPGFRTECSRYRLTMHMSIFRPTRGIRIELIPNATLFAPVPTNVTVTGFVPDGYENLGCYTDTRYEREMTDLKSQDKQLNSPKMCGDLCTEFKYFGLQNGFECWCGNSYGKHGKVSCAEQSMPCPGNSSFGCGGRWVNHIYRRPTRSVTVSIDSGASHADIDLSMIENAKYYDLYFAAGNGSAPLTIRSIRPYGDIPPALTEDFSSGINVTFSEHQETLYYAAHAVLGGPLVITFQNPTPRGRFERAIMQYWSRVGQFSDVVLEPPQLRQRSRVQLIYHDSSIVVKIDFNFR